MADTKISALTTASSISGADLIPIVQSGSTKALSFTNLQSALPSAGQIPFDAVVVAVSGGDYTTVSAAVTAGKTNIRVKGAITETGSITLSANTYIEGQGRGLSSITWSAGTNGGFQITTGTNSISFKGIKLDGTNVTDGKGTLHFEGTHTDVSIADCYIINNGSGGNAECIKMGANTSSVLTRIQIAHNRIESAYKLLTFNGSTVNVYVEHNYMDTSAASVLGAIFFTQGTARGQSHQVVFNDIVFSAVGSPTSRYGINGTGNPMVVAGPTFQSPVSVYAYNQIKFNTVSSGGTSVGIYAWTSGSVIFANGIDLGSDSVDAGILVEDPGTSSLKAPITDIRHNNIRAGTGITSNGNNAVTIENNNHFGTNFIDDAGDTVGQFVAHMKGNYSNGAKIADREFQLVKNHSGGNLAVGDVVVFDTSEFSAQYIGINTTTTGGDHLVMGVAAQTAASGDNFWVLTRGYARKINVFADGSTNAISIGSLLQTYTTAKQAVVSAISGDEFAIAGEAKTTAGTIKGYLIGGIR